MILDTVAEPHFIKCVDLWGGQGVVVAAGQAMGRISFVIFRRFLWRFSQSRHAFGVLSIFFQFSNSFVCSENGDGCGLLAERELLPRTSRPYHQPQLTSLPAQVKTNYSNVGRLFCTPAPPKFTKKLAVDSFFNFGS